MPVYGGRMLATHSTELMITPRQAWRMIADGSLLSAWYAFGGALVEPVADGRFELCFAAGEVFRGRVEIAEEPRRLVYRLPQRPEVEVTDDNSTRVELTIAPSRTAGRSVISVTESDFASLAEPYSAFEAYRSAQVAWIGAFGLLVQATGLPPT